MNLFKVNFSELYDRHLCRHSQFGLNVFHILAVLGIYLCLYSVVYRLVGIEWPLLGIAGVHLAILALNLPLRVLGSTVAFLAIVIVLVVSLPTLPAWAYALAIYPFYKIQAWSHMVYNVERDMTDFNKKYRKGFVLFVLLSVYEVPILLKYLVFDKNNWPWLFSPRATNPSLFNRAARRTNGRPNALDVCCHDESEHQEGLPTMQANVIQRQYDEVIAPHYDFDPQSVIGDSLERAIEQIQRQERDGADDGPMNVLDLGVGTGRFLEELRSHSSRHFRPYGLDISQKMIEVARRRIPDLMPAVDDAANLEDHFQSLSFDLICTHFLTGFVPLAVLAPKVWSKLECGGIWSFVGGTKAGFPEMQRKAAALPLKRWLFGGSKLEVDDHVCNPTDQDEVTRILERYGFTVCESETFCPNLHFTNFNNFMEFAYYGGWLTPFLEALGLHKKGWMIRTLLNTFFFPAKDHHKIVIALARKL